LGYFSPVLGFPLGPDVQSSLPDVELSGKALLSPVEPQSQVGHLPWNNVTNLSETNPDEDQRLGGKINLKP